FRSECLALLVAAVAQQEWPALPVGDPVAADRGARGEQFLCNGVAFEKTALAAAVAARPGHADPAARAEAAAEIGGAVRAEIAVRGPAPGGEFVGDEFADFLAQRLAFGRRRDGIETERRAHRRTIQVPP